MRLIAAYADRLTWALGVQHGKIEIVVDGADGGEVQAIYVTERYDARDVERLDAEELLGNEPPNGG